MKTLILNEDQVSATIEALQSFFDDQEAFVRHYWLMEAEEDERKKKASKLRTVAEVCNQLGAPNLASQLNELADETFQEGE